MEDRCNAEGAANPLKVWQSRYLCGRVHVAG